ncbi:hypothetical protein PR048_010196 [Dryococelus australis]|uniref:Uncharacterized protein n=1 Tax=Dryococelus australis TaxID=614101 RepID=A0ABQ9I206_9NEOP|nr:hypothetical protein PR048_010196 [Dryococelus australis]
MQRIFFKSFYIATLNISNVNITVSEVIPTINGVQRNMIYSSSFCFRSIESNTMFAIATLLDPRFKKTVFTEPRACASANQHLIED